MSITESRLRFFLNRRILMATLVAIAAAGGILWWLSSVYNAQTRVPAVAITHDINAPAILTASDLKIVSIPNEAVPRGAFTHKEVTINRLLTRDLSSGAILTQHDLISQRDPDSAATLVPLGRVGFVLSANWLSAPIPRVKKNDFVTVYVAFPASRATAAGGGVVVQSALVLAVNADRDGITNSALLALDEDSMGRLLQAHTNQYPLVAVVESASPAIYKHHTPKSDSQE